MRVSDRDIEHALMPSSGLRSGKSTLYKALLDLKDARDALRFVADIVTRENLDPVACIFAIAARVRDALEVKP